VFSSKEHSRNAGFALSFSAIRHAALSFAGGKAANLGELTRTGLPVPLNFCVTTAAYDLVEEDAGLESILAELIATPADDTARLAELAAAMRAGLLAARLPASVTDAIARAHRMLEDGMDVPVAVRSSATAGNLPYASFAG